MAPRDARREPRSESETRAGRSAPPPISPLGNTHTVRFEPVGLEIEVDEDETILNAAFRQGLMLMHGCKEGQCSACKSFLLDGEVDLDRYSTFALPDFEEAEGWTLLCRAHPVSDLEVELINYDEEILRSGTPIRTLRQPSRPWSRSPPTSGSYVCALRSRSNTSRASTSTLRIPGHPDEHRSFSMAGAERDVLEFMIKLYPDGRFSGLLSDGSIKPGDALEITGPYGIFTLRASSPRRLLFIGGGAGMAPILSLLRSLSRTGNHREATYYYGARTAADLFYLDELDALPAAFVPALSGDSTGWSGETGLITDVVERLEHGIAEVDAYVCGPPPMVEAAIALLEAKGVPESHIYFDKFTASADA